jgi:energy-coupling factor transport system permease protein
MISDITLGQFFPGKSPLHKLDPRTKILLATVFIIAVFLANTPIALLFMAFVCLFMLLISRISSRVVIKGIKPIIIILIITSLLNVFMTKGEGEPLVSFWIFEIYAQGIFRAVFMTVRVILLIIGTSLILTYTTSPISLTDGIESLFKPLKLIGVPVHSFAMMMTIALRFIPTLIEETEKIMNAQKSRGADFTSGGLIKRVKALIPILIPLFVSSFKRAEELAIAMECRCYRGDKNRTKLLKLEFKVRDYLAFLLGALGLTLIILSRRSFDIIDMGNLIYKILFYKV